MLSIPRVQYLVESRTVDEFERDETRIVAVVKDTNDMFARNASSCCSFTQEELLDGLGQVRQRHFQGDMQRLVIGWPAFKHVCHTAVPEAFTGSKNVLLTSVRGHDVYLSGAGVRCFRTTSESCREPRV